MSVIRPFIFLVVMGFSPFLGLAGLGQEPSPRLCDSIEVIGASVKESESVCKALDFLIAKGKEYGFEYKPERPLTKVVFQDSVIFGDDHSGGDSDSGVIRQFAGKYEILERAVYIERFEVFKERSRDGYKIDYEVFEGALVVHEIMHYFTHVNSNMVALDFFNEAASYFMEVEYIGINKVLADRGYEKSNVSDFSGYEMSDSLYEFYPILYSIASWAWVSEKPKERLADIFSGKVTHDYIYP